MSLELEREQVVQDLCHRYAQDQMSTSELELRLEAVYKAATREELDATLSGLPVSALPAVPGVGASGTAPSGLGGAVSTMKQTVARNRRSALPAPNERRILSVFGSVKKRGEWVPAPLTKAVALFGEIELDFREALLGPGVTTVNISATFAEVRVIVPPGLAVECDGTAILGEFSEKIFSGTAIGDDAPVLRIIGMATLSEVKVKMRLPDDDLLAD